MDLLEIEMEDSTQDEEQDECAAWVEVSLKKESLIPHITEEIALEGLDGITLQALKERLARRPGLPIQVTEKTMDHVWNIARKLHGIQFYKLPEPRPDLVILCRSNYVDERWNWYEPLSAPEDIYSYKPAEHPQDKSIRGSCLHFKTRKLIPKIRTKSYEFVDKTYGNSLVLVACQEFREAAIFGSDSDVVEDLTTIQYCMLERIARARYDGELTRGKVSLNSMKIEPKSLFYHRKFLLYKELITKQLATMKFGKDRTTSLISILHLPRFYTPIVPMALVNARRVINYLLKQPKLRADAVSIKKIFGKNLYRTLVSPEYSKIFKEENVLVSELHPELLMTEKKEEKKEVLSKRMQKVLTYLNPETDVESLLPTANLSLSEEGDAGPIDDKNSGGAIQSCDKGILNLYHVSLFDTQVHQVQTLIVHSGTGGITLPDIAEQLQMLTLPARAAARYSIKLNISKTMMVEKDKTKVNKYIFCDKFPVGTRYSCLPPAPPPSWIALHHPPKKAHYQPPQKKMPTSHKDGALHTQQDYDLLANKGKKQKKVKLTKAKMSSLAVATDPLQEPSFDLNLFSPTEQPLDENYIPVKIELVSVHNENSMEFTEGFVDENEYSSQDSATLIIPDNIVDSLSKNADASQLPSSRNENGRKLVRLNAGKVVYGTEKRRRQGKPRPTRSKRPPNHEGVYYDEKDREALAKKHKQRVNWTAEEDQCMLLLFISSVVFIRRYNLNKLFIFNAPQLRDMLHVKSLESTNKTSLAIRRRLHFLIRNQQFKSKYQFYLHDAVHDDYIQQNFVDDVLSKITEPQKIFHEIPTDEIFKVYDYLAQKYTNYVTTTTKVLTKDSSSGADYFSETSSTSQYDEELMEYQVEYEKEDDDDSAEFASEMENVEQVFTGRKGMRVANVVMADVDETSSNLAFAEREVHIAKKRRVEAYDVTESPIQIIKCSNKKLAQKVVIDAESDVTSVDELEKWISRSVVFTLMFSGDSLDDVQPFLQRIGNKNLEFVTNHFRRLNICSVSRRSHKFGLSSSMRRRLANHIQPESYRIANRFLDKVIQDFCGTHPSISNNSASLFILAEFLIHNMVFFNIVLSKEFASTRSDGEGAPVSSSSLQKPIGARKAKAHGEDALSVSLPAIKAKLDNEIDSVVYKDCRPSRIADLTYLAAHLLKVTPHKEDDTLDTQMESLPLNYLILLQFIEQSKEIGVSMRLLKTKFTRRSLRKALIHLIKANHIYMIGIAQRKFVSVKYVLSWTMKIPPTGPESNLRLHRVIIQPWITSLATINWDLINVMFTAIIGVLSNHPRIRVHHLITFLNPVLSGVEVMTLLEALIHLEFVTMHKFVRNDNPSLFAARTNYSRDDDVDVFLDLEELSVELQPFVSLKYAHLQEIFDPKLVPH